MRFLTILVVIGFHSQLFGCTITDPPPPPWLFYNAPVDGVAHKLSYYWDTEETLLVETEDGRSKRIPVSSSLRADLLARFTMERIAFYEKDQNGYGDGSTAPIPNCPASEPETQTICTALELTQEKAYVSIIHPDDPTSYIQDFYFEAPTSMSFESAEMLVFLSDLTLEVLSE